MHVVVGRSFWMVWYGGEALYLVKAFGLLMILLWRVYDQETSVTIT